MAERARSAGDARRIRDLRCDIERYLAPPEETAYPLEYAHHLLGDVRGKSVLDLGCGSGANTVVIAKKGARTIGLDISHELLLFCVQRLELYGVTAKIIEASAYETGLQDESIDVVFANAVLHHLDLESAREEIWRLLKKGGFLILREPICDSKAMKLLRARMPFHDPAAISPFERQLTARDLRVLARNFIVVSERRFRLPIVKIASLISPGLERVTWKVDRILLRYFKPLRHFATGQVLKLQKPSLAFAGRLEK